MFTTLCEDYLCSIQTDYITYYASISMCIVIYIYMYNHYIIYIYIYIYICIRIYIYSTQTYGLRAGTRVPGSRHWRRS